MRSYQRPIVGKVVISGVQAKVGISNGRTRHVNSTNDLLKKGRGVVVGVDVVNGEE